MGEGTTVQRSGNTDIGHWTVSLYPPCVHSSIDIRSLRDIKSFYDLRFKKDCEWISILQLAYFEMRPRNDTLAVVASVANFCVGFPHTLSGAAIFLSLFICMRPSVVTWSLAVRERTLGMRKLYAFRRFAAIILFYICEMFMASLTRRLVSAKRLFRDL